ncbi:amylo-alpha-1,6-glucosidase [Patescibacteria group bacterium]
MSFPEKNKIIDECYNKSINLLIKNTNQYGVMAASCASLARERRYINIFGRDACICSMGMVASQNEKLISAAKKSLKTLAQYQSKLGQIPYSVNPARKETLFYYMGDKDSTLWWLIALKFYYKYCGDKKLFNSLQPKVKKALTWLFYQDQNNCGLIEQCEASDWADLMPSNGSVLYTNVLWYKVLDLYGYKKEKGMVSDGLNNLFCPFEANEKKSKFLQKDVYRVKLLKILQNKMKPKPYYLNYVSSFYANNHCDVYGNILAILFDIADKKKSETIIKYLIRKKISHFHPVQVFFPPVQKKDDDWRDYFHHKKLNLPFGYQNGGIWPYIGGFWVIALAKLGKNKLAWSELEKLAQANRANNWQFNEWFHGKTGKPMGMPGQSWNAGTYLLAFHYLKHEIKL